MSPEASARWDDHTKKLVAATVGKGLDAANLALLEHMAISRGLDPLNNELYAIPKGNRATFITSINGMLKVVAAQLDGVDVIFYDAEANSTPVWLPKAPPAACAVTVYRRGCSRGFTSAARFDDYKGSNLWQKMPSTMIRKVALAAALRLGFSDLLGGLYAQEEMDQAGFTRPEASSPAPKSEKKVTKADPEEGQKMAAAQNAIKEAFAGKEVETEMKEAPSVSTPEPVKTETVPAVDAKVSDDLPERTDLKGAIGALYKQARLSGLTVDGWSTLEKQCGGEITSSSAAKALPALKNEEKVAHLNAGRTTTGVAI
ncbi:recT family protein [Synechococcus sp. SYN20]|uniref:recombinase RecT n=1 Tax=Synechococcus sp. SYN20 TaxID=1050714 RepID=UPI00164552DA|nr:recombinase RecT [Synechococcus sp. SYN20]QNJ25879.1 recT family protein [Synechococcus sp. SYN20]